MNIVKITAIIAMWAAVGLCAVTQPHGEDVRDTAFIAGCATLTLALSGSRKEK
ncbi:hypothetical protein ACFL2D_02950 [Patescibacteria group bacterium]